MCQPFGAGLVVCSEFISAFLLQLPAAAVENNTEERAVRVNLKLQGINLNQTLKV